MYDTDVNIRLARFSLILYRLGNDVYDTDPFQKRMNGPPTNYSLAAKIRSNVALNLLNVIGNTLVSGLG